MIFLYARRVLVSWCLTVIAITLLTSCAGEISGEHSVGPISDTASSDPSDSAQAIVVCLRDRGWEISNVDHEGWVAPGVSEAQFETYQSDVSECTEAHGGPIEPLENISEARWRQAYADVVESAECLRGQGFDIPETPSFQAWKETYFVNGGADQWVPWGFVPVPSMSGDEFRTLESICPQVTV